ncbi:MAG TPA: 5-methyltetrahydropteroyltriglutamate--homocysteine S-methyltransferase [Gammaproteobacteria bacterium]|nr:5-methyltetrahydropteroyltriglutamate--homocysteine S-methyltransferase [Gammaproteobacteria bacterium]
MKTGAHILGFGRIGRHRELILGLEAYWAGQISQAALIQIGQKIRQSNWAIQAQAGCDLVTVGDFAWTDQVLEMSTLLGIVPKRFQNGVCNQGVDLDMLFRIARGSIAPDLSVPKLETRQWFDTYYHYIVPELEPDTEFQISTDSLFNEISDAQAMGYRVKPVLIGPITFLWLAKSIDDFSKLNFLDRLLFTYQEILSKIRMLGVEWVQIDEPILVLDIPPEWQEAIKSAYRTLKVHGLKILVATYFGGLKDNTALACELPVEGLHIDLVSARYQLKSVLEKFPEGKTLSCGIIDGRNIWRTDLKKAFNNLIKIKEHLLGNMWVATSASLLHCPIDLAEEKSLSKEIKSWLAFGVQKIEEVVGLAEALTAGDGENHPLFTQSNAAILSRRTSLLVYDNTLRARLAGLTEPMLNRPSSYPQRALLQRVALNLPTFPTTTIGSFPKTHQIHALHKAWQSQEMPMHAYEANIRALIKEIIEMQENLGLDVLVHGEPERQDRVAYFAELLEGFLFTENGWIQKSGTQCIKPPIIYGDIKRSEPMTVCWTKFAQSLTKKPVKAILTGPFSLLFGSFVRDDQQRSDTLMQIALALRDEILDLEANGINIIQLDEPYIREGLPLLTKDWEVHLQGIVSAFKVAVSGVKDRTQIHAHLCGGKLEDLIKAITALDADVLTFEAARSQMAPLKVFEKLNYPNEIGPGVYDPGSLHVPSVDEIVALLERASHLIPKDQIWVNPDCDLQTRSWNEIKIALGNMVKAAKMMRK